MQYILMALVALAQQVLAQNSTLQNSTVIGPYYPQLNNTIDQGIGPVIPYNGTDGVPPFFLGSPPPTPLPALTTHQIEDNFFSQIVALYNNNTVPGSNTCTQCIWLFELLHLAALTQSDESMTRLLIRTCDYLDLSVNADSCQSEFAEPGETGPYLAQALRNWNLATGDMQAFCHYRQGVCDAPPTIEIDEDAWFPPKPANKTQAPAPSGDTIQVLHFSDWHIDPRFDIHSEANCSQGFCCRVYSTNTELYTDVNNASIPASRWGDFLCDTTADLGLSAFKSMHDFVDFADIDMALFTGDLISHDQDPYLSIAYNSYESTLSYHTFKAQLGSIPLYSTLGNHDTIPSGYNAPNYITNGSNPMSWDYELISSLWAEEGWLSNATAQFAATHYGAYATTTAGGLKIISLNTDFWYVDNPYSYINFTNPDISGILRFTIDELLASEAADQRVWIIGHVPSGSNSATTSATALFASIVRRFSPATIAGVFFGHTHTDQISLYYDTYPSASNSSSGLTNTTNINYNAPLSVGWVGPSITPLTNYNAGWVIYQVDAKTFDVVDAQTYVANISDSHSSAWDGGPVWKFEYDTRSTYNIDNFWPDDAPLNATFWDAVTTRMMSNGSLVDLYNYYYTKGSAAVPLNTTAAFQAATICEIRSGSAAEFNACLS